jgi:pimeloyl-ACP methyl ester carboxylesterase
VAIERWYGAAATADERREVAGIVERTGLSRAERLLERIAALGGAELRVPPYAQRAVVLHSRGDGAVPFELGRELASLGSRAVLETVESARHMLPLTDPELVARHAFG